MTIEEICNKYIKVKATGILALHQRPKLDWAFRVVSGKESDVCKDCFLEKYYPLRLPYTCAAQQREDGKNVQFKKISKTMTREEIREAAKVMEAYANGKKIQYLDEYNKWIDATNPSFNWSNYIFRIKPEPKYRPFKTQEECWEEMHKHPDFGWVTDGYYKSTISVKSDSIIVTISSLEYDFGKAYIHFTFADGTPFGIKEE